MLFLEQTQGFGGGGAAVGDAQPPSLFELLMQDRMASGFKPAAEYLVHSVCESYPQAALAMPVRYFDESFALLRFFMERYFLTRHDSLATEKFYGMKRVLFNAATPAVGEAPAQAASIAPLTARDRYRSLLFAVRLLQLSDASVY